MPWQYSEKTGVFTRQKSRELLPVISVSNVSHMECSMCDVDVYVVSKYLGDTPARK